MSLAAACSSNENDDAGASGAGGIAGSAGKGSAAPGGGTSGASGMAGSSGTTGKGGGSGSSGASGAGGRSGGGGGKGGAAGGSAGKAGATSGGSAGNDPSEAGGSGQGGGVAGAGGSAGNAAADCGDSFVSDVTVSVHEDVNTILVVEWTQTVAADETWLEFSFEEDNEMTSRPKPGVTGAHRDVVLGVPGDTDVAIRVVSRQGTTECATRDYESTTDPVPSGMPESEILAYDAERASPERWLFGSVEDSDAGGPNGYYRNTFWLYIMDRKGRIVWYYADPSTLATSSFQRIARDGGYIWIEKRCFSCSGFEESVLKMTLDHSYEEEIEVPGLADAIDVTDDGSLLYDANDELREMDASGDFRTIWSCTDHFPRGFICYTNTINWNAADDTVMMSYPEENTVIQVSRATGEVVGQYGEAAGSYDFAAPLSMPPTAWGFGFQHFPNISADGTLMVSSHMPGYTAQNTTPTANQHAFLEFEIDRENERLIEKWRYTEGPEWPRAKGMAIRLENGNTLGNYGTGGVIREITPDKETVFHVKFDHPEGNDAYNKMVGHNVLIDDLYALNVGGPE
ncbi:MAG TPA: hypothetical protein VGK73_26935 [Polyangiaceae bacterium]